MYTEKGFAFRNRALVTALTMLGWLGLTLGWLALAWGHYSFLQNLASLGIAASLFVAVVGALWVLDMGYALLADLPLFRTGVGAAYQSGHMPLETARLQPPEQATKGSLVRCFQVVIRCGVRHEKVST